jgi:hypothetical protein
MAARSCLIGLADLIDAALALDWRLAVGPRTEELVESIVTLLVKLAIKYEQ